MNIQDRVYGSFEINEPVLIELLNSKTLQRLKGISQHGLPREYYHLDTFNRYEHSVGVFLLLRKLGASLEEQISGLLHDASHTAFSHVIDTLWGDPSIEDYQDSKHLEILLKSDAKSILEARGFSVKQIADCENFGLLERDAPDLCADRLDYTLRELSALEDPNLAKELANQLIVHNGKIIFNNLKWTKIFSKIYLKCNREHWAGFEAVSRYVQLANILREAMDKHYIDKEDVWQDDMFVINKIYQSNDKALIEKLDLMKNPKTELRLGIVRAKKFRHVNPEVLTDLGLKRLTELDLEYKELLDKEKLGQSKGMEI